jgi:hypothetical protein
MYQCCETGDWSLLQALVEPPFSCGRSEAIRAGAAELCGEAVRRAHFRVVSVLADPPYLVRAEDMLGNLGSVLRPATVAPCGFGYALTELGRRVPGFSTDRMVLREAMRLACCVRDADALSALGHPPFSLGHADAVEFSALAWTLYGTPPTLGYCESLQDTGSARSAARMVARLARPPWSLARRDAEEAFCGWHPPEVPPAGSPMAMNPRPACAFDYACARYGCGSLRWNTASAAAAACAGAITADEKDRINAELGGPRDVLLELSEPPYGFDGEYARRCGALRIAIDAGNEAAISALGSPPFCLGRADAAAVVSRRELETMRGATNAAETRMARNLVARRIYEILVSSPFDMDP